MIEWLNWPRGLSLAKTTGEPRPRRIHQKDIELLIELQKNANIKDEELAKAVNLTGQSCRLRKKKLRDMGILQGETVVIDFDKLFTARFSGYGEVEYRTNYAVGIFAEISWKGSSHARAALQAELLASEIVIGWWAASGVGYEYLVHLFFTRSEQLDKFIAEMARQFGASVQTRSQYPPAHRPRLGNTFRYPLALLHLAPLQPAREAVKKKRKKSAPSASAAKSRSRSNGKSA
jgi:DNA-binding Lrp family transcriptional regulator